MYRWVATTGLLLAIAVWSGPVLAQGKPPCDPQGRVMTPQKVEGQVVKIDAARNLLTVRETNGTMHEFQASKETLQDLKVGDRVDANLREAPKCP
jgi:hypothetical protein